MTEEKAWLTCREASVLLNCTQRHVLNLLKKKNVSTQRDEGGKYYIQKSEFYRVFPHATRVELDGTKEKPNGSDAMKFLEERVRHLQEMFDEKKKQNEFLTEQLNNFTHEKLKMLDALNSHTRLLEYKETTTNNNFIHSENKSSKWWHFNKS